MKELTGVFGAFVMVVLAIMLVVGYFTNIYKLFHLDFESPYKAEILRGGGVAMPWLGGVLGHIEFDEEK